jgi:hypothetical protein
MLRPGSGRPDVGQLLRIGSEPLPLVLQASARPGDVRLHYLPHHCCNSKPQPGTGWGVVVLNERRARPNHGQDGTLSFLRRRRTEGKMPLSNLEPGEAGESALREVTELLDGGWEEEDAVLADNSPSAGRRAGDLADDPQGELAPALLRTRPEDRRVVAVVETVRELATRHYVGPQPATAEREAVERADADGEGDLSRTGWPDLVAGSAELLQVGVTPGDENAGTHAVIVRR